MNQYFWREHDLSSRNLAGALALVRRDLEAMEQELGAMLDRLTARQVERARNYADGLNGGMRPEEIAWQEQEEARLAEWVAHLKDVHLYVSVACGYSGDAMSADAPSLPWRPEREPVGSVTRKKGVPRGDALASGAVVTEARADVVEVR